MLGESLRERFGERPEVPIHHDTVKLLASETRLNILKQLDKRRMTVSELARAMSLNKSTVHEHLAKLVDGGLIRRDASEEREFVYYELTRTARYVLQPSTARFVLMMGVVVIAGLVALAFLHVALTAGQGLAVQAGDGVAPAGEANLWSVEVTRTGLLGSRQAVQGAEFYLLSPEQAVEYQLQRRIPAGARAVGEADGLTQAAPGSYAFRAALPPGVHYLLAKDDSAQPGALTALRAEPVEVRPGAPTLLLGVDGPSVEVAVRFQDAPVPDGLLQAVDPEGRALAQVPVLQGKAVIALQEPSDTVTFRFRPAAPGSSFAEAEGVLRAPPPKVAFEPARVPTGVPTQVRVVVDDPLQGPRAGAPVSLVAADGRTVAEGLTDASGGGSLTVRLREPGEFTVRAGSKDVGRVVAQPGLRLWVSPGPHWEGDQVRVRTLLLGSEPEPVPFGSILLDGREVGVTDAQGWLTVHFALGGRYDLEARRDGHVAGKAAIEVLPRTGALAADRPLLGFSLGAARSGPGSTAEAEVQDPRVLLGGSTTVRALVRNPDSLPRVVRAELREDGRAVAFDTLELAPGAAGWASFEYQPKTPGLHRLAVNDAPAGEVEVVTSLPGSVLSAAKPVPAPSGALAVAAALGCALALGRRRP